MIKHCLTASLRSLNKNRLYTTLSIGALAIGLAMAVLAAGHAVYEYSFEDMHENRDRIYRIETRRWELSTFDEDGNEHRQVSSSPAAVAPLGPALMSEIPEIEMAAVFREWEPVSLEIDRHTYQASNIFLATPEFLKIFTLPLVRGNPHTALEEPFTMLITQEAAEKYFGTEDPVGREANVNGRFDGRIVGVLKDIPHNTDVHCEFVVSYATLEAIGADLTSWEQVPVDYLYLLLQPSADPAAVERKVIDVATAYTGQNSPNVFVYGMRPLKDIHFGTLADSMYSGPGPIGEFSMVLVLLVVAGFILFQAIANYANLSIARGAERIREVGVRKVFGAARRQLATQFLTESLVTSVFAMLLSIVIYEMARPAFNRLLGREAWATIYDTPMMAIALIGLVLVTGFISGAYPALYISRFKPVAILQRRFTFRSSRSILRKVLVTFQFVVAIFFIICTTIIYRQTQYLTGMDLGFDTESILVLDFDGEDAVSRCRLMKNEILNKCDVVAAAATNCPPGRSTYRASGYYPQNDEERELLLARMYMADRDFVSMFGLELTRGQAFSESQSENIPYPIIVNESAVSALEIGNPIGYSLPYGPGEAQVVGVVKDFHGSSFGYAYRKLSIIVLNPDECDVLAVKLRPGETSETLAAIGDLWQTTFPDEPFSYSFLEDEVEAGYSELHSQGYGMLVLALLTTLIACMGILGLVSYSASQRTKEVGIRRVLGAGVSTILNLLTREFILLVALANIIAWPLSYLFIDSFLSEFAYRVSIGPGTFLLTGAIALLTAMASSSVHALRVAHANPVEALRCE